MYSPSDGDWIYILLLLWIPVTLCVTLGVLYLMGYR